MPSPDDGDLVAPDPKIAVPDEVAEAVRTLIRWAGDDPDREGLLDTPARLAPSTASPIPNRSIATSPSSIICRSNGSSVRPIAPNGPVQLNATPNLPSPSGEGLGVGEWRLE